jgi:hypothetical protein
MRPQPQPSDADLARIAPHQARQAAKSSGGESRRAAPPQPGGRTA